MSLFRFYLVATFFYSYSSIPSTALADPGAFQTPNFSTPMTLEIPKVRVHANCTDEEGNLYLAGAILSGPYSIRNVWIAKVSAWNHRILWSRTLSLSQSGNDSYGALLLCDSGQNSLVVAALTQEGPTTPLVGPRNVYDTRLGLVKVSLDSGKSIFERTYSIRNPMFPNAKVLASVQSLTSDGNGGVVLTATTGFSVQSNGAPWTPEGWLIRRFNSAGDELWSSATFGDYLEPYGLSLHRPLQSYVVPGAGGGSQLLTIGVVTNFATGYDLRLEKRNLQNGQTLAGGVMDFDVSSGGDLLGIPHSAILSGPTVLISGQGYRGPAPYKAGVYLFGVNHTNLTETLYVRPDGDGADTFDQSRISVDPVNGNISVAYERILNSGFNAPRSLEVSTYNSQGTEVGERKTFMSGTSLGARLFGIFHSPIGRGIVLAGASNEAAGHRLDAVFLRADLSPNEQTLRKSISRSTPGRDDFTVGVNWNPIKKQWYWIQSVGGFQITSSTSNLRVTLTNNPIPID